MIQTLVATEVAQSDAIAQRTYQVEHQEYLKDIAAQQLGSPTKAGMLLDLNADRLIEVPQGKELQLPENKTDDVTKETALGDVAQEVLGKARKADELWRLNKRQLVRVPAGTVLQLPDGRTYTVPKEAALGDVAQETLGGRDQATKLFKLNQDALGRLLIRVSPDLAPRVPVPAGTTLVLPEKKTFKVKQAGPLGEVAREVPGGADRVAQLWELNRGALMPEVKIPEGTELRLPQTNAPALAAFGVLCLVLVLVGLGLLFRAPPGGMAPLPNGEPSGGPLAPGPIPGRGLKRPQGE